MKLAGAATGESKVYTGSGLQAHVLVVDDDPGARAATVMSLRRHNKLWSISEAATLEEARLLIQSPPAELGPIDVVLTDLVLGNNNGGGIDVLEMAKRKDPFIMVILFTAQEKNLDRFEAYKHGAFDCIEKNILGGRAWQEISVKANAAINFRQLAKAQVADQKQLANLSRFLDPRVLEQVVKDPRTLGVRLRRATVVFWDVRGFSDLCHRLTAQPLLGFVSDYYGLATEIVFRHGGILDKFMGDIVMAIFCDLAAEGPSPHDARPAIEASLRLRATFEKLCRKWGASAPEGAPPLGLATAVHTGDSLVGLIGPPDRGQLTAIGQHVNFAAKLRDHAQAGDLLLTDHTRRCIPPLYDVETRPPLLGVPIFHLRGTTGA
jgi:class 3 adenylate cyclase/CheY-like chemotaxis protein